MSMKPQCGVSPTRAVEQGSESRTEKYPHAEAAVFFRVFEHEERQDPNELNDWQSKDVAGQEGSVLTKQSDETEGTVQSDRRKEAHNKGRRVGRGYGLHH
jgi:hypothetical protein